MIEFPVVAGEIRSLIERRRELNTLLGSVFVAAGVFLDNAMGGKLPRALVEVERHLFAIYAAFLLVPSALLALRMARLHGGLVLNGMLYARTLESQTFTRRGDVDRASRHRFASVSFLQFALADVIAGFSGAVMALTLGLPAPLALAAGLALAVACLAAYAAFHRRAVALARRIIAAEDVAPATRDDWEVHISASLHDANAELIGVIGFVGLILFSTFEVLSGLGQVTPSRPLDLHLAEVERLGPPSYTALMLVTALMGLITYLRIRVAIGRFSIDLDPLDQPFRPLIPTDSLLGYLLLAFFLAIAVHLATLQIAPNLGSQILLFDAAAVALAVLAEQTTLVVAGRRWRPRSVSGPLLPTPIDSKE